MCIRLLTTDLRCPLAPIRSAFQLSHGLPLILLCFFSSHSPPFTSFVTNSLTPIRRKFFSL